MTADDPTFPRARVITPPVGVPASAPESWEGQAAQTPVPTSPSETLHAIGRRVKATAQSSQATLDRVGALHAEIDARVDRLDVKVDALAADLADVREATGQHSGKLDMMLRGLDEDREERRQRTTMSVTAFSAEVEVKKTRALSEIEVEHTDRVAQIDERKAQRAYRRALGLKILAGLGAVWALVSTLALAKCG